MQIRKAIPADIDPIMQIFRQAQASLKAQGVDQWQNGYPNPEIVATDIAAGHDHVCVEADRIAATVTLSFNNEKTYEHIYNGRWLSTEQYGVIHRMAVADDFKGQGLAAALIRQAEQICLSRDIHSLKVDTHRHNQVMQNMLVKSHFLYCGIIYLTDGQERLAFEKLF